MKFLLILLTMSLKLFAASGSDLITAREAAIDEAVVELNIDDVMAFDVTPKLDDKIGVRFLLPTETFKLNCHFHGDEMACHNEDDDHNIIKKQAYLSFLKGLDYKFLKVEVGFDHIIEGHNTGLGKLEKTFRRKKMDLDALKTIKVWKLKGNEGNDGHEHGEDVWTKVTYDLNNKEVTVFIQCHKHKDQENFACHYKRTGKEEPIL